MLFGQWMGVVGLLIALLLLWSLKGVLLLLFLAIVIAIALCLPVAVLQNRAGWPRPLALITVLVALLVTVLVTTVVLAPPFIDELGELIERLPRALRTLLRMMEGAYDGLIQRIYGSSLPSSNIADLFRASNNQAEALERGLSGVLGLAGNLGNGVLRAVFVLAVAGMITVQPSHYRDLAIQLAPSFYRRRCRDVLDLCGSALRSWLAGLLISSLCVAVMAGIGLSLLGVKLVVANALLAGLLNVIPNIGPVLSTVFPASVALLDSPLKALGVVALYVVIQNIESYVITPKVMHHQVKLLPGLTLLAQFIFTVLLGPLGLFMALPLAVVLQVLIREVLIRDVLDQWLHPV